MIHVIATITLKRAEDRPQFLKIFTANVPAVLAEDGCLAYGPCIDFDSGLPPQLPLRPAVVTIIEQWQSLEHLRAHLQAPHMLSYKQAVKDLVEQVRLQVLEPA